MQMRSLISFVISANNESERFSFSDFQTEHIFAEPEYLGGTVYRYFVTKTSEFY